VLGGAGDNTNRRRSNIVIVVAFHLAGRFPFPISSVRGTGASDFAFLPGPAFTFHLPSIKSDAPACQLLVGASIS